MTDASLLCGPREVGSLDTQINSFSPQGEAENWEVFSTHFVLSKGYDLCHLPAQATISVFPWVANLCLMELQNYQDRSHSLENMGCWVCEPIPFFRWVKLGVLGSLPDKMALHQRQGLWQEGIPNFPLASVSLLSHSPDTQGPFSKFLDFLRREFFC